MRFSQFIVIVLVVTFYAQNVTINNNTNTLNATHSEVQPGSSNNTSIKPIAAKVPYIAILSYVNVIEFVALVMTGSGLFLGSNIIKDVGLMISLLLMVPISIWKIYYDVDNTMIIFYYVFNAIYANHVNELLTIGATGAYVFNCIGIKKKAYYSIPGFGYVFVSSLVVAVLDSDSYISLVLNDIALIATFCYNIYELMSRQKKIEVKILKEKIKKLNETNTMGREKITDENDVEKIIIDKSGDKRYLIGIIFGVLLALVVVIIVIIVLVRKLKIRGNKAKLTNNDGRVNLIASPLFKQGGNKNPMN